MQINSTQIGTLRSQIQTDLNSTLTCEEIDQLETLLKKYHIALEQRATTVRENQWKQEKADKIWQELGISK